MMLHLCAEPVILFAGVPVSRAVRKRVSGHARSMRNIWRRVARRSATSLITAVAQLTGASPADRARAHDCLVLLAPDVDYRRMSSELSPDQQRDPARVGAWLADAWSEAYRSRVPDSLLLEFEEVATFLFDQAGAVDAPEADRTIAHAGSPGPAAECEMLPTNGVPIACRAG